MPAPRTSLDLRVTGLIAVSLLFIGMAFGAIGPYQAIVAIEGLDIPNAQYAAILTAGSLIGAAVSVALGWVSDRVRDRRKLVVGTAFIAALGPALVWFVREPWAFIAMSCALMPIGGAAYSQTLAFARAYLANQDGARVAFMMTAIRAIFAVSWVIAPPLAGWIAASYSVFDPYALGAAAALACTAIFLGLLTNPRTQVTVRADATEPTGRPGVPAHMLVGIGGVIALTTATRLNGLGTPLAIVNHWHGSVADVGIYASLAALIEIPFMIGWGYATRYFPVPVLLALGSALFAVYVFLAGNVASVPELLWLQWLNGLATAALMSLPISYVQEAIRGRIGLSTSLLDVISVAASLLSAAAFAVATSDRSYLAIFDLAAVSAAAGALVVGLAFLLSRRATSR